jgi:hypothetical protein
MHKNLANTEIRLKYEKQLIIVPFGQMPEILKFAIFAKTEVSKAAD